MPLRDFDASDFLARNWQKEPLLMRGAWPDWANPLDPDSLAGLACEAEVEARLVLQNGSQFSLEHGPFAEERLALLPAENWSLLVQAVDHWVPDVAALLEPFRFVPNWRIDDVMVSLAADGGGVGPHFDQYDVFLIQGLGRRRWQIGGPCDAETPLLPHDDLHLLADFRAEQEWILEPGDILYVPPGIAHDGAAVGNDCMTYSIGFRAPSRDELATYWADEPLVGPDIRYADPDLAPQDNPGEIRPEAIDRLHALIAGTGADRAEFTAWFCDYASRPKYPEIDWTPDDAVSAADVRAAIRSGASIRHNPASRFAFVRKDDATLLCVDGAAFECVHEMAALTEKLGAETVITLGTELAESDEALQLIADLINQGSLAFDSD